MSTPTLERIDLSALGIEEPVLPCNMSEAVVCPDNGELLTTPPRCPRAAKVLVIFHHYCWTCTSCQECYDLYCQLVDKISPDTMTCGTCKQRDGVMMRAVPLNAS